MDSKGSGTFTLQGTGTGNVQVNAPLVLGSSATYDVQLRRTAAQILALAAADSETPLAYTLTVGESSRGGTDTNVAGASGTIRSGIGTGNAAASSLIFQTPTVGASGTTAQTMATRLTVATAGLTATVPYLAPDGTGNAPGFAFSSETGMGWSVGSTASMQVSVGGTVRAAIGDGSNGYTINAGPGALSFGATAIGAQDVFVRRLAAQSLALAAADSATPAAYTLTVGESSRGGTDTNVAGANGTIRSGAGTGTGAASSIILQTPTLGASGTTAQTMATRLTIASTGLTIAPVVSTSGSPTGLTYTGAAHTTLAASTEAIEVNLNLSATVQFATGALTTQRAFVVQAPTYGFVGASTITTAETMVITGAPIAGTNATITTAAALAVGGATTQVTAAGLAYNAILVPAHTLTVTGTVQVTSSTTAMVSLGVLTITDTSIVTYDIASTLYIAGPPAQAGSVTLTSPYSIFVDAGISRFDGSILIGVTAVGTGSPTNVLVVASGTVPTSSPADSITLYSTDISAGNTEPSFYCEGTAVLATAQADSVSSVRVKMRINGTEVTILCI